jgi:hypothetical protein
VADLQQLLGGKNRVLTGKKIVRSLRHTPRHHVSGEMGFPLSVETHTPRFR